MNIDLFMLNLDMPKDIIPRRIIYIMYSILSTNTTEQLNQRKSVNFRIPAIMIIRGHAVNHRQTKAND
jgi:hypothetical protein